MTAGENDGYLILKADPTKAPGVYVGCVYNTTKTGTSFGSGTFVSQRVFLTCAHTFFDENKNIDVTASKIYLEFNGDPDTNNRVLEYDIDKIHFLDRKNYKGVTPTDIAVIITKTPFAMVSRDPHPAKLSKFNTNGTTEVRTFGYPGDVSDDPRYEILPEPEKLHYSPGKASYKSSIQMGVSTGEGASGMSGGGVFEDDSNIIGVNVGHYYTDTEITSTLFVPVTDKLYNWVNNLIESNKINGWYESDGKKYYFDNDKQLRMEQRVIGTKQYTFNSSGVMVHETVAPPKPSALFKVTNINFKKGEITLEISSIKNFGPSPKVEFVVTANGITKKYTGIKQNNIKYVTTIKISDYNRYRGVYMVTGNIIDSSGKTTKIGESQINMTSNLSGKLSVSNDNTNLYISVTDFTSNNQVKSIKIAVWTTNNGQDDLKWYDTTRDGNDAHVTVPMSSHGSANDVYNISAYAELFNSQIIGIGIKSAVSNNSTVENPTTPVSPPVTQPNSVDEIIVIVKGNKNVKIINVSETEFNNIYNRS